MLHSILVSILVSILTVASQLCSVYVYILSITILHTYRQRWMHGIEGIYIVKVVAIEVWDICVRLSLLFPELILSLSISLPPSVCVCVCAAGDRHLVLRQKMFSFPH